jgi:hypothetical protein
MNQAIGSALGQGHNLDDNQVASLGGFGDLINSISMKRVLAMFSMLPDKSIALTVSLFGMKLFHMAWQCSFTRGYPCDWFQRLKLQYDEPL